MSLCTSTILPRYCLEIRFILIFLLAFSGFMRIIEFFKYVKFTESGMTIFFEKSKVDQLRERSTIFISKNYSDYCPVKWLRKHLQLADLTDPESFIICRLAKCKKGHSANGKYYISSITALDNMRKVLPNEICLLYTSPSPRDGLLSRMPSSA